MGRRSRHSAKTGDAALYGSRGDGDGGGEEPLRGGRGNKRKDDSDDDAMYDEVDRHYNRKEAEREEFLRLDGGAEDGSSEEEDDGITRGREGVFDLGVGGSDDEDESSSGSEDEDESPSGRVGSSDDASSSSDDDDSIPDESDLRGLKSGEDVLDWGKRKSAYYHGDTADIEIGQAEEDAELEEEAGREVLRKRMEGMDEDDFRLDDDEEEEDDDVDEKKTSKDEKGREEKAETLPTAKAVGSATSSKLARLSKSDRRRLLGAAHPEFLPLVEHFRDGPVRELRDVTRVLCGALLGGDSGAAAMGEDGAPKFSMEDAEAVGATPAGLRYLLSKALLQTSSALNVCQYLLLKSEKGRSTGSSAEDENDDDDDEEDPIRSHPVISRLRELNDLSDKLADDVESKVPDLAQQVEGLVKAAKLMAAERKKGGTVTGGDDSDSDEASTPSSDLDDDVSDVEAETAAIMFSKKGKEAPAAGANPDDSSSEESEDDADARRRAAAEARFGLRGGDVVPDGGESSSKTRRRRRPAPPTAADDYGDEDEGLDAEDAGRKLARAVNALSQRKDARKKAGVAGGPETVDDQDEEKFRRGLEMMEADIGSGNDEDDSDDLDGELDEDEDDDGAFYARIKAKSSSKKSAKRAKYAVAPKYPNLDVEVEGERGVSRFILKNRGLVAHKNKLNRNPRVKKREQYRKALVRRKGAVRDVRTDEGHKYGGESTGIKAGISRSRKIGVQR